MNQIQTRTVGKDGQIFIPHLLCEKMGIAETDKVFLISAGKSIIIKRQSGPEDNAVIKDVITDIILSLPLSQQFDTATALNFNLAELAEKSLKGGGKEDEN